MAAPSMEKSGCAMSPPTPKELATILELQAETMQLLEARKWHVGAFNVLYSELEEALVIEEQLRRERASLRAELLSLGATLDFEPSQCQESEHALREQGAKSIAEFIVYLLNSAQHASSEGFNDKYFPPNFQSLIRFFDSQPHGGAEALGPKTSIKCCECPLSATNEQPTTPTSELGGAVAVRGADTSGRPSTITTCHSCNTSQLCGHEDPTQPMVVEDNPQNLEPHAIEMPIQRDLPRPMNAFPVFSGGVPLQGVSQTTKSPIDTSMQHDCTQATSTYECTVQGNVSHNEEDKDFLSLEMARTKVPPIQNEAEAHNSLLPTDSQRAMSSNPMSCLPACVEIGSPPPAASEHVSRFSAPMTESNSTSGERLLTAWSHQPKRTTVELSSTASSSGVVSSPVPHGVTTLVVRNVPARYTKEMLMQEWPPNGMYDFLYLPFNFKQKRTSGFAYVNFTSHEAAVNFYSQWHGKSLCNQGTAKQLSIGVAGTQGLEANLRHVAASNIGRIKNLQHMPSVFNGVDEVPLVGLLDQITSGT